jgi:hypothetical protein
MWFQHEGFKAYTIKTTVYVCLHNITFFYNFLANAPEYFKTIQNPVPLKSATCAAHSVVICPVYPTLQTSYFYEQNFAFRLEL